mmetsp:Transcript_11174/g.38839  ORF Transcript_11174/g.38839 Transcript_11174/m.38839 type:complete len:103 (-) Transcript_11174:4129-4437(-)
MMVGTPEIKQSGWLRKRSPKGFRPWQRRWFILQGDELFYYDRVDGILKGSIACDRIANAVLVGKNSEYRHIELSYYIGTKTCEHIKGQSLRPERNRISRYFP